MKGLFLFTGFIAGSKWTHSPRLVPNLLNPLRLVFIMQNQNLTTDNTLVTMAKLACIANVDVDNSFMTGSEKFDYLFGGLSIMTRNMTFPAGTEARCTG